MDRADINEDVFGLGIEQVGAGDHLGIECVFVAEIFFLEAIAVDLVESVELEVRFGFEGSEGANGLGGQCAAIDEEENASGGTGSEQSVGLIHGGEGLARAGSHGDEHLAFAEPQGPFDGVVGEYLVRAESRVLVRIGGEPCATSGQIDGQQFAQGFGGVEVGDFSRDVFGVTNVVKVDHFAVGRIEERDAITVEVEWAIGETFGVAFGLGECPFGTDRQFFGFDDPDDLTAGDEGIICRAACGGEFFDRMIGKGAQIEINMKRLDDPAGSGEVGVDAAFASLRFRFH